ncbi:hypothetical protein AKJ60_00675 [candidate division MSBL1 archaeon SCGC-AAA385M11]|nr:hypothetical protein AKJ60_00675 [candidate division MSBL1 archaeon SCGC-AAA385M11]
MSEQSNEYDNPWKMILRKYLPSFMHFFFPCIGEGIDWHRAYEFLDKELGRIRPSSDIGDRYADLLIRLYKTSGQEIWFLVHIEIQAQPQSGFGKRMFVYNYRIFDLYDHEVVSLAVLADTDPNWRPHCFRYGDFGSLTSLEFPVVKVLDYGKEWSRLEQSNNPFAVVVMAHLKAMETGQGQDIQERYRWKLDLILRLYRAGFSRDEVIDLFTFIDWVLRLPAELEDTLWSRLQAEEEERNMPYVTSVERIGIEKGRQEGRQEGIQEFVCRLLKKKYALAGEDISALVSGLSPEQLEALGEVVLEAENAFQVEQAAQRMRAENQKT